MKRKMQTYLRSIKKFRRKIRSGGTILRCRKHGGKIKNREIGIIARKAHDRIVWSYGNEMNETQSYHRSCLYYPLAVARRQYLLTFFNVKMVGTIEEIVINAIEFRFVGSIWHQRVLKCTLFLLLLSNI